MSYEFRIKFINFFKLFWKKINGRKKCLPIYTFLLWNENFEDFEKHGHEGPDTWHVKRVSIRHGHSRIIRRPATFLRLWLYQQTFRQTYWRASRGISARKPKSYALSFSICIWNEKSHNACGRKWVRWKRNRSGSTVSRDITHTRLACIKFRIILKNCLRSCIVTLYMAHYNAVYYDITRVPRYTKLSLDYVQFELEWVFRNFGTETQKLLRN